MHLSHKSSFYIYFLAYAQSTAWILKDQKHLRIKIIISLGVGAIAQQEGFALHMADPGISEHHQK